MLIVTGADGIFIAAGVAGAADWLAPAGALTTAVGVAGGAVGGAGVGVLADELQAETIIPAARTSPSLLLHELSLI